MGPEQAGLVRVECVIEFCDGVVDVGVGEEEGLGSGHFWILLFFFFGVDYARGG